MKIETKKINDNKFEITCEVDQTLWKEEQKKARDKALKNVDVKGFRKGKAPANLANGKINEGAVFNDAINGVLPTVFDEAIKEAKVEPFMRPDVAVDKLTKDELTVKFTVITRPTVTLGSYKGHKIDKDAVVVTNEEVSKSIQDLLKQNAELVIKDGAAEKGDTVILDFEGFVDGKPFEGGKAENHELELGSGAFIPGFEDQLIGTKANDEKDINVKFPENYTPELKGKDATFKCKIHEVKVKKIPELNEETVKDLAIENVKTVADLEEHQRKVITGKKNAEVERKYYDNLIEAIVKEAKLTIPEELVKEEANYRKEDFEKQMQQRGLNLEQYLQITGTKPEDFKKQLNDQALKSLQVMLVLNEICRIEKIEVTDDDVKNEYSKIASQYKMDVKKVEEILGKDIDNFKNQIKSNKLHDLLISLNNN